MNKGNRKHVRLLALTMSLAVVGMLAAFIALAAQPGPVAAQGLCDGPLAPLLPQCGGGTTTPTPEPDPGTTPAPTTPMTAATGDMIESDSTSASGSPQIELTIAELGMDLAVGSSIVLYLEDDFAEPDSIPMSSVYLVAEGGTGKVPDKTGNGSRVYVTSPVKIKTGAYFDEDKKDIAIRVLVPDMCTTDTTDCQTSDGPKMGQKVTLIIESDSGIKNPSEAGTHSVFFDLVGSADPYPSASNVRGRNDAMRAADSLDGAHRQYRGQDHLVRRGQQARL